MSEPIVLSWSGGKDSSLALQTLRADPCLEVVALLTSVTSGHDRVSIHGVRRALLESQAHSLGLPLYQVMLEPESSNEAYEAAFARAVGELHTAFPDVRRIAFGDLFLEDVRAYRERLLAPLGFEAYFPLWGENTDALARRFIDDGFRARLVCVDTTQLDGAFVGREFDRMLLGDAPADIDPCGENGEFHTFVTDGPVFGAPIACTLGERVLRDGRFAYQDLIPE